jgi:hypothetical protein
MADKGHRGNAGVKDNRDGSLRGLAIALVLAGIIASSAIVYAYASSDRANVQDSTDDPVVVEKPIYVETVRYLNQTVEVEKPVYVERIVEIEKEVPVYINNTVVEEVPVYVEKVVEVPVYVDRPVYVDLLGGGSPEDNIDEKPKNDSANRVDESDDSRNDSLHEEEDDLKKALDRIKKVISNEDDDDEEDDDEDSDEKEERGKKKHRGDRDD